MFDDLTTSSGSNQRDVTQSLNLQDVMEILFRRKGWIAGWLFVSLGLGTIYLFNAQPTFKVASRVLVQPEGSPLGDAASPRREAEFLATQSEIISSPVIVQRAVTSMELPLMVAPDADPVLAVLENLLVKPVSGTNVLSVAYRCKDSTEGISLVEAILDSYQRFVQEMDDGSRLETLRLITQSEQQLRSELESREQGFRELRKQSPLVGQGKDARSLQKTMLEKLGQSLADVRERRIDFQNRKAFLEKSSQTGLADGQPQQELTTVAFESLTKQQRRAEPASWSRLVGDDAVLTPFRPGSENAALDLVGDITLAGVTNPAKSFEELYRAEVRQKELAQNCGPDHPAMRAAQETVASWKERLQGLNDQASIALQREIDSALSRENELVGLYNQELEKVKDSDEFLIVEQQELEAIERLTTMHGSLVFKLNDWRLLEPADDGVRGIKMAIIEAPTIGAGPVWPKTPILLALCAAMGLLAGIGSIVVLERDALAVSSEKRSTNV